MSLAPLYPHITLTETTSGARKDGSVVKSTSCSSRGCKFNSQQLHGSSQPSVIPVPGALTLSSGSVGTACMWDICMYAGSFTDKVEIHESLKMLVMHVRFNLVLKCECQVGKQLRCSSSQQGSHDSWWGNYRRFFRWSDSSRVSRLNTQLPTGMWTHLISLAS